MSDYTPIQKSKLTQKGRILYDKMKIAAATTSQRIIVTSQQYEELLKGLTEGEKRYYNLMPIPFNGKFIVRA